MNIVEQMAASKQRRAEREEKANSDRRTLIVGWTSAFIALAAAGAAFWAGYEARQTRIEDERPFLALDVTKVDETDEDMKAKFASPFDVETFQTRVASFGKTPARAVEVVCAKLAPTSVTHVWDEKKNKYYEWSYPYILPGRDAFIMCPYLGKWEPLPRVKVSMVQFGVVRYKDLHNDNYTTPFCNIIVGNGTNNPFISMCLPDPKVVVGLPPLK